MEIFTEMIKMVIHIEQLLMVMVKTQPEYRPETWPEKFPSHKKNLKYRKITQWRQTQYEISFTLGSLI